MPTFIIEREMRDIGGASPNELKEAAQKSNGVLRERSLGGEDVQWIQSFVAHDKVYCVYRAPNTEAIREHSRRSAFPADRIELVQHIIDPTTGE
ncbi:MAG TPA: DUF4242 domain-containing protein [Gemmatimonadaceae bacterium]|nr:DUF4242 domain-containing protein [Gemmatimonadaceae bacterium]